MDKWPQGHQYGHGVGRAECAREPLSRFVPGHRDDASGGISYCAALLCE